MWWSILSNCWCVRRDFSASSNSSLSSLERVNSSGSFSSWLRRRATFYAAITAERFNCSTPLRLSLGIKLSIGPSPNTAHPPSIDDALMLGFLQAFVVIWRKKCTTNPQLSTHRGRYLGPRLPAFISNGGRSIRVFDRPRLLIFP